MNRALLILILAIFLVVIAGGISKRTNMAVAPPIYDPISYYCKAQLVWSALEKGDLHGLLNGPMSVRPPGTALVLYPFGFRASVRSFLFRSVFAPILIWMIALAIPIATQVGSRSDALLGGALVLGLTTMPLFYKFECNETFDKVYNITYQWGLVDSLQGAFAALSVSLLGLSISVRSVKWCAVGWLVGAFTFFIKPSGLLVMMTLIGVTAVEFIVLFFGSPSNRRTTLKFAALVYLSGFCLFGVALWLAVSSDYMSRETIAEAVKACQSLRALNQGTELFALLALFVVPVIGWWWFCPGVFYTGLVVVETVQSVARRQFSPVGVRLAVLGMILASAVYWWIFLAGQQHRYLYPFLLMAIAWFLPDIFQRIRAFEPLAKGAAIGYCLAPAFLLGNLLWAKLPSITFQQLMGVNLSAGDYGSEVNQGQWLMTESERLARPLSLYCLGKYRVGVVEMMDWVRNIETDKTSSRFVIRRPFNWIDVPGLRADDLLQSDFLLLEDIRSGTPGETSLIASWQEEVERFKQFAYSKQGVDQNGLELVSDGPVKLLRVADPRKFSEALYTWANSIQWKNDFRERNKAFLEKLAN